MTAQLEQTRKSSRKGALTNVRNYFSIQSRWILRLIILTSMWNGQVTGMRCFSCHGECYSEGRCNCQTGMCEGDYCFTEKWGREGGFFIYKGCGKGRPRIGSPDHCDFQRVKERPFCLCNDEDFCNEWSASSANSNDNATCLHCSGGACNSRCNQGDYCLADFVKNQYTCAFGPPLLPFHYQGRELQQTYITPWPACASFRAGPSYHLAECACTNPICNNPNLREHMYFDDIRTPLVHCHSCAEEMLSETVLPTCRRQTCIGHYCAIKVESTFDALASATSSGSGSSGSNAPQGVGSSAGSTWSKTFRYKMWSGCLNTTRPEQVLKGTFQRWTVGTRQVTECVCKKDYCNLDVKFCMRARADGSGRVSRVRTWLWGFIIAFIHAISL